MTVVLLGDANVDLLIRLPDHAPGGSAKPVLTPPELHGGGTTANTAVALARLGIPAAFVGTVGDDGYGRFVRSDLAGEGVDVASLRLVPDGFTTTVFAVIHPGGERTIYVWPPNRGADNLLRPEDLDPARIAGAAWLHTSGVVLRASPVCEAALRAMQIAREAGVPVSIDLNLRLELWGWGGTIRALVERAVALADVVFGSGEEEIIPLTGAASVEAAARALSDGTRTVVARLGAAGALAVSPGQIVRVPAFSVPVIDTLGAGDAFNGGFIAARVEGRDLETAVRWGCAVSALKIGRAGARGLPRRDEVERLLAR